MKIIIEGVEKLNEAKLMEVLRKKFNAKSTGELFDKLEETKIIEFTGEFEVHKHPGYKTSTRRLVKVLGENGLVAAPKAKLDLQKLANLVGADNMPGIIIKG